MSSPSELSIEEIRKFMLDNSCKVTNHALVKHFKHFLTHPQIQNEARKQFKIYVNILATIKNENGQKYLILRKKYINECPPSDVIERAMSADALGASPSSPGGTSIISESSLTSPAPFRQPPPYKPPPDVTPNALNTSATLPVVIAGTTVNQENIENYRDCVNEFEDAVRLIDPTRLERQHSEENENELSEKTAEKENAEVQLRDKNVSDAADEKMQNQEKIPRFSFSSGNSATSTDGSTAEKVSSSEGDVNENSISVKEAMRKFNRIASEEEAKTNSPVGKKIPEKQLIENKIVPEVTMAHPKAKEWLVSMAKANYQELAKLANEYPELVKLQDPALGYTALHWAAKHGNEDVIKLIAGTYKADVNARTNGGYTPLHLAMQFGRVNIFELLCNVYKANRDLTDWSGNKPLDYSKQCTSVSALTYSSEYYDIFREDTPEFNNNFNTFGGFNSLLGGVVGSGIGGTLGSSLTRVKKRPSLRYSTISSPLTRTQSMLTSGINVRRQSNAPPQSIMQSRLDEEGSPIPCNIVFETSSTNSLRDDKNESSLRTSSKSSSKSSSRNAVNVLGYSGNACQNTSGTLSKARRKRSFMRKSVVPATSVTTSADNNKDNLETVTNQTIME